MTRNQLILAVEKQIEEFKPVVYYKTHPESYRLLVEMERFRNDLTMTSGIIWDGTGRRSFTLREGLSYFREFKRRAKKMEPRSLGLGCPGAGT